MALPLPCFDLAVPKLESTSKHPGGELSCLLLKYCLVLPWFVVFFFVAGVFLFFGGFFCMLVVNKCNEVWVVSSVISYLQCNAFHKLFPKL